MNSMIPLDIRIESMLHRSFIDFYREENVEVTKNQLQNYHRAGYRYKIIDALQGDVNDLIQTAESPLNMNPDRPDYSPFIKAEKLAALRLLDFNSAAELAKIDTILRNPNPKTTLKPMKLPTIQLIMYYCVFIKGKDIYIQIDTNYKQYKWELQKFFRSLKKQEK